MTRQNTISIFFDGTGNGPRAKYPSNVYKLYNHVPSNNPELNSWAIYIPGPGASEYDVMAGNLSGVGIWENVKKAYRFVTSVFNEKTNKDSRFLVFGFSRGSYTAHLFTWLLYRCGIPTDIRYCDEYVELFQEKKLKEMELLTATERTLISAIEMIGVWDVVKSVAPNRIYWDGELPPIVKNVYHAMALDELRKKFPVLKWRDKSNSNIHQVWFAGVHSDIGGGYATTGLSDITLNWMYKNAVKLGLLVDSSIAATLHEDFKQALNDPFEDDPIWKTMGKVPRQFEMEEVHPTVKARLLAGIDYKPKAQGYPLNGSSPIDEKTIS